VENSEEEDALEELEDKIHFIICNDDREIVYSSEDTHYTREMEEIFKEKDSFLEEPTASERVSARTDRMELRGKVIFDGEPYYVFIYKQLRGLRRRWNTAETVAAWLLLLGLVLTAAAFFLSGRKYANDLRSIDQHLKAFAAGDRTERIRSRTNKNELSHIAGNLNKMVDQLQEKDTELQNYRYLIRQENERKDRNDEIQKERTSNLTHQLKTPLAIISSQIELNQSETDETKREYYYNSMMEEIEKMSSLISRILRKEYADEPDTPAVLRRVCLSDILQELVPKYENWLKVHGIHFEADITPDVYVMGDTDLIEQAVHNYIMNAFGHTRQGKKIILTFRSGDKECVLGVYNDGSGIAEAEKERIWERGYRSGTEKTFGSGLGLYIVRQIALTHQGSCGTVNEKAGVLFWIKLPLA